MRKSPRRKTKPPKQSQQPRKHVLPQGNFTASVNELLTDGRGLASVDGKKVMIRGALPNETVKFTYTHHKKQFFEGEMTEVVSPSPDRVTPRCAVFSHCGGCVLQHLDADKQIDFKQQQLLGNLRQQIGDKAQPIAAPLSAKHWGYRHRARVGLQWQADKQSVDIGFRARASSHIVPTDGCAILAPKLSNLFVPTAEVVAQLSQPGSITHVEMTLGEHQGERENDHHSTTPHIMERAVLTFRHVKSLTADDTEKLQQFAEQYGVDIFLQSGGDDSVVGLNHTETPAYFLGLNTENDRANHDSASRLRMDFLPYHFTQVNFTMNRKMLEQALHWLDLQPDDCVLDLFCGLGNFTLPIAQRVKQVVGVEGAKALVEWAKRNAKNNHIDNAEFYQADLTQNTQMMAWRVKYDYNKILIDPPRAGAQEIMPLIHALKPEKVVYVSCHAATLARDLRVLVNDYGYRLRQIGAMDMFPQTAHVEAMVLLSSSDQ